MKNLSKLVNKMYTSAERDISGDRIVECLLAAFVISRLLLSFVGRLSTVFHGHQTPAFRRFIIYKKYVVVRLDTKNPF